MHVRMCSASQVGVNTSISGCCYLFRQNTLKTIALTETHTYLYLGPVQHKPAEVCKFSDMCEGLWVEAVAGRQVELLQRRARLGDDLHTGFIQEVTTRQLQADHTETTGFQKTEKGKGEK